MGENFIWLATGDYTWDVRHFFLLSSIFLRKISYFRSYGDKFWYHHVKKTFVIICVYSMKIDKNDVKFVIFRL